MSKNNFKKGKWWKKVFTVLFSVILAVGVIFGIGKLLEASDNPMKEIHLSYEVGLLNENGEFGESTKSIYTKDAFECQGLKITPDFDNVITYQVFFYDSSEKFITSTETSSKVFEITVPEDAKYARILIKPINDEKVSWYEIYKYSTQLQVEVYKEQAV